MLNLKAKKRKNLGKKIDALRKEGILPGVLYGPKIENIPLEFDLKEFIKVYKEAGESSLIDLELEKKGFPVLIHDIEIDALSQQPIHVDLYQPNLDEEIAVWVPLVFEGEAPAVKDLSGTLVKNVYEIEVKALPQKLPNEIKVDIGKLKTFDDEILVEDLLLPEGAKTTKDPKSNIVLVAPPEKVEEDLEKPIEENVENVEKVEKKGAEEETPEA